MSRTANRVMKNTGFLYVKMGITVFISLWTTRLVLNSLGTADYGIFNVVGGAIALLGFLNAAMASATQRFLSFAEGEGNAERQISIFNVSIVLHFFIGLIAALLLLVAGYFFFNGILNIPYERIGAAKIVYGSLILSTVFHIFSIPYEATLNAHENMKFYAIVGILEAFLKLAVAYICVYTLMDKLIVYGILMASVPVIILCVMRIYCHNKYSECKLNIQRHYNSEIAREMGVFAGWKMLSTTTSLFTMQGMAILLNMFGGVIVNTAHGIANQLAGQLLVFSNNMLKALNPVLVKSQGAGNTTRMLEVANTGNKLSFSFYAVFAIPFIVETPYILQLWLKQTPEWAVLFVRLVLLRQLLSQVGVTLETCVNATGKIRSMTIMSSLIWISPIIVGYFLYKLGSPIYTIYLLLFIMVLMRTANALYFCRRECGMNVWNYLWKTFLPCFLSALLTITILFIIANIFEQNIYRILLVLVIGTLLFCVFSMFLIFDVKERRMISDMVSQIIKKLKKLPWKN